MNKKTFTFLAVAFALAWAVPAFAQADDVSRMETQISRTSPQQSDLDKFVGKCIMRLFSEGATTAAKQVQSKKQTPAKKQAQPKKQAPAKKQAQPQKQAPAKKLTKSKAPTKKQVKPDISPSVTQGGWHSII